jgi:preprotein translocase subunit YajC
MEFLFAQSETAQGGILQSLGVLPMFLLMFLIIYFMIIRPQVKQQKKHTNMLGGLKKGDKIITRGGVYGKIVSFQGQNDSKVVIDVGGGNKLNVARSFISGISNPKEEDHPTEK